MKKQTTELNKNAASHGETISPKPFAATNSIQQALLVNETKLEAITDVPVLILMADIEASCTFVNQAWLDYSGRSLKYEIGNGWKALIHKDDLKKCLEIYIGSLRQVRQDIIPKVNS